MNDIYDKGADAPDGGPVGSWSTRYKELLLPVAASQRPIEFGISSAPPPSIIHLSRAVLLRLDPPLHFRPWSQYPRCKGIPISSYTVTVRARFCISTYRNLGTAITNRHTQKPLSTHWKIGPHFPGASSRREGGGFLSRANNIDVSLSAPPPRRI